MDDRIVFSEAEDAAATALFKVTGAEADGLGLVSKWNFADQACAVVAAVTPLIRGEVANEIADELGKVADKWSVIAADELGRFGSTRMQLTYQAAHNHYTAAANVARWYAGHTTEKPDVNEVDHG